MPEQDVPPADGNVPTIDLEESVRLVHEFLRVQGLPGAPSADAAAMGSMAFGRRAGIRALDRYIQQFDDPIEPMTTPNWLPHDA